MGYQVNGVGAFGFGLNWVKVPGDQDIAQHVLAYLENRRLLFGYRHAEDEVHCVQSAIEIRDYLTEQLGRSDRDTSLSDAIRAIRLACRRFVEQAGPNAVNFRGQGWGMSPEFPEAIDVLRTHVAPQIAVIAIEYGIEIEDDLASILSTLDGIQVVAVRDR